MKFGAHLPLIDFGAGVTGSLADYVDAAREAGVTAISANDHLVYGRPWLDGIVALSSVADRSADLTLATTVALPVVRGPVAVAKFALAMDALSGGRFVLGVGPGSSPADYDVAGIPFDERWPRFNEAVGVLRSLIADGEPPAQPRFYDAPALPRPDRPIPIWVGSWGSAAGLRRVARLGDGWIASAYNTTPERLAAGRESLHSALSAAGREERLPVVLATMWTHVTESRAEAEAALEGLSTMLKRDPADLADQVLVGPAETCASLLARYADAGVDTVFVWPLGDPIEQLRRFGSTIVPAVG